MDILYVGTLLPHRGGSGITSSLLVSGLATLGHTVRAVAPIATESANVDDPLHSLCPEIEVRRYRVPFYETDSVGTRVNCAYRQEERCHVRTHVLRLVKERAPDLILVGRESFVHEIPEIARRLGIPWVLRLGGHLLMGLDEGRFPTADAEELKRCFQTADLVLAQAEHVRLPAERFGCRRIAVISNTVDLDQFSPRPKSSQLCRALGIGPENIVVAHASNLKSIKRVADLVKAAPIILTGDPRIRFLIVGDGPCLPELERMVSERRLQDHFRFTGWVDYGQMPEYFSVADIVVMPSEREQQARVYMETQAMERALIASDIAGAQSVVEHELTGLLFPMGDVNALASAILRVSGNPDLRMEMAKRGRLSAAKFSIAGVSRQLAACLSDLVRER